MRTLLVSALAYRRIPLLVIHGLLLSAGLVMALSLDSVDVLSRLLGAAVGFCGLVLLLWHWNREQQERRLLLWLCLPVGRRRLQVVRLLVPFVLQLSLLPTALLCLLVRGTGDLPTLSGAVLAEFLSAQGLVLLLVYTVYLSEELSLLVRRSKWGLGLLNLCVGLAAGTIALLWAGGPLPEPGSRAGILLTHGGALLMALVTIRLFVRRRTFLFGISPIHGLPEDWSSPSRRDSR